MSAGAVFEHSDNQSQLAVTADTPSNVTVRRPPGRWPSLGLRELWDYRDVCVVLAKRALKVRYEQTLLGASWAVIQPVSLAIVFTVFFGLLARMPSEGDVPFVVFYLSGIVVWHSVARLFGSITNSLIQNKALIEKVYFPRIYFPLSLTLVGLVDLGFGLLAVGVALVLFHVLPGWQIVALPLFIVIAYATVLGAGLWTSVFNSSYRDVGQLQPFLTQIWFFASPILYPASFVPDQFASLYYLNPMAFAITGFRWATAGLPAPPPVAWLISPTVALLILVSGYLLFKKREPTLDDVL